MWPTWTKTQQFLAKEWKSFHLLGKKLDYLHLKDSLKYVCGLYLKQLLTPPQCKIIVAYHTSNQRLAIELDDGRLSLSLEILDNAVFGPTM